MADILEKSLKRCARYSEFDVLGGELGKRKHGREKKNPY
jgi:hypothetical protein